MPTDPDQRTIEIVGDDGTVFTVDANTPPDEIHRALQEHYATSAPGAPQSAVGPEPGGPRVVPAEGALRRPTATSGIGQGPSDPQDRPAVSNGTTNLRFDVGLLSPAQRSAYDSFVTTPGYNPQANPGSPQNPIYVMRGALPPAGAAHFDPDGNYHPGDLNTAPGDQGLGFMEGLRNPWMTAENWLFQGASRLLGTERATNLDRMLNSFIGLAGTPQQIEAARNERQARALQGYRPGQEGQFVGSTISTAPLAAIRNPLVAGAAMGAVGGDPSRDFSRVAEDAGMGAAMAGGTEYGLRGLGAITAPNIRDSARRMHAMGIPMTPGNLLGGTALKAENVAEQFPGIGDMITGIRNSGLDGVNREAVNRALRPIGEELPANVRTGHRAIDYTHRTLGREYDRVEPHLRVDFDSSTNTEIAQLVAQAHNTLSPELASRFENMINLHVISPARATVTRARGGTIRGTMTGQQFRAADSALGAESLSFRHSGDAFQRDYGNLVRDLQRALRDNSERHSPQWASDRLRQLNEGYSNLAIVDTGAAATRDGRMNPSELRAATQRNDHSARDNASARGNARMQELASDAIDTQSPGYPGAGNNTSRMIINALGAGALYGGIKQFHPDPVLLTGLSSALLPYTGLGNRLATSAIMDRPSWAPWLRGLMDRSAPIAGRAAAVNSEVNQSNVHAQENAVDGFGR